MANLTSTAKLLCGGRRREAKANQCRQADQVILSDSDLIRDQCSSAQKSADVRTLAYNHHISDMMARQRESDASIVAFHLRESSGKLAKVAQNAQARTARTLISLTRRTCTSNARQTYRERAPRKENARASEAQDTS